MLKHGIPLLLIASGVMFFAAGFLAPLTNTHEPGLSRDTVPKLPRMASSGMRADPPSAGLAKEERDAADSPSGNDAEQDEAAAANVPVNDKADKQTPDGQGNGHANTEHADKDSGEKDGAEQSRDEEEEDTKPRRHLAIGPLPKGDTQPWRLVRELQLLQDDIARGRQGSVASYREAIIRAGRIMASLPAQTWEVQRNLDAAAVYLLIGGNPATGDVALARTTLGEEDRLPLETARAYSRKDLRKAQEMFERLDPVSLAPSARGQFALARSMIYAAIDADQARKLLEEARRQSPGTLIEEAALRRLLRVSGEAKDVKAFGFLARTYQDRFRASGYFGDFVRNFVLSLSMMPYTHQQQLVGMLEALCATLPPEEQLPVVGNVAKRSIVDGKTHLAQWAAGKGLSLLDETSKFRAQFKLYLGAAQVVEPDKTSQAIALLEGINRDHLDRPNRLLLDAVLELSRRITGEPVDLGKAKALLGREQQVFPGDEPQMPVSEGELEQEVSTHHAVLRMKTLASELEAQGLEY